MVFIQYFHFRAILLPIRRPHQLLLLLLLNDNMENEIAAACFFIHCRSGEKQKQHFKEFELHLG